MGKLIYSGLVSLDGYVADENGKFDWGVPDDAVHAFVNDLERGVGTYLYGRRMYDVMVAWEAIDVIDQPEVIAEYAEIWRAADKVVYSRTLETPRSDRTEIRRAFDPEVVRAMKVASERDLSVGGPTLAALALAAGLVDECQLLVSPIVVGGGRSFWPPGERWELTLLEEHRFANGVVHLRYGVR